MLTIYNFGPDSNSLTNIWMNTFLYRYLCSPEDESWTYYKSFTGLKMGLNEIDIFGVFNIQISTNFKFSAN